MKSEVLLKKVLVCLIAVPVLSFGSFYASGRARAGAEKDLQREETIASAAIKVFRAEQKAREEFEDRMKRDAADREFNRSVYGSSEEPPEVTQRKIEGHLRKRAENSR